MLEFSIAAESIHAITNLLAIALGLSSLVCLAFIGPLLRRRLKLGHRLDQLCKLVFAGLAGLQAFAWHLYLYRESHDAIELGYLVVVVAVGLTLWQLTTAAPSSLHPRLARCLPPALACLALAQLAGFAVVTRCFAEFKPNASVPVIALPGALVVTEKAHARTDLGTVLNLYERTASPEEFELFLYNARRSIDAVTERAMRRDAPELSSNCHGWVFTSSQYVIHCEDVPTILDENGYVEVATPALNDVVIYRNGGGQIVHTGVVRGFLDGDSALVEGKWGAEGTYLHLADEQPYSQNISYWHTDRGSHTLTIVPAEAPVEEPAL